MCRCRHRNETARDSGPGTSEKPGCHNLDRGARTTTTRLQSNGPTAGLKTDTELPPMGSVVINVQGASFDLPTPDADVLDRAAYMATEYCNLLTRTPSAPANPVELRATLHSTTHIRRTIKTRHHALAKSRHSRDRHRGPSRPTPGNGPNEERATRFLANDPRFDIVRQIITEGGHIDTPPDFVRTGRRSAATPPPPLPDDKKPR